MPLHMIDGDRIDETYPLPVLQRASIYLSGTCVTLAGVSAAVSVPANATSAILRAEGGIVYWEVNPAGAASATSPGYIGGDSQSMIGPISNLNTLAIFGAAAVKAHIEFFQDK